MDDRKQLSDFIKKTLHDHGVDPTLISAIIDVEMANYRIERCGAELATPQDSNKQILDYYAASLKLSGRRDKTITRYLYELRRFSDSCNVSLVAANTFDVQRYLASFIMAGKKSTYIDGVRQCLSAFYTWACKQGIVAANPLDRVDKIIVHKEQEAPFSSVEISALRDNSDVRSRAMVEFLLATGARISEMVNIKISDIDFQTNAVRIRDGKGGKARTVYMTAVCSKYVKEYIGKCGIHEYLFVGSRAPHDKLTDLAARKILKQLGEKSGVNGVHPHRFRHTCASILARSGMPVQEVQKYLGHSNINTTMIYVSVSDDEVKTSYQRYANM